MKKKWLTILLSTICVLICAAFGGCNLGDDNGTDSGSSSVFDSDTPFPDIYGPLYEITYETTEYLLQAESANPQYAREGEIVTITTTIIIDADLVVYANGEAIEQIPFDACYQAYTFVMPDVPVHITFDVVSTTYLTEFEPWLVEISAEDIASIKQSDEIAGIAPGHFIKHYTVTDGESIAQLLPRYQYLGMTRCKMDDYVTGGLSREVTFTMKGGATWTVSFYQGLYMPESFSSLTHYHVEGMPSLANLSSAEKSYSFIAISGVCDVFELDYENGGKERQVGEGNFITDLKFVEYHGEIPENMPTHVIVGQYFNDENKIYVVGNSLFFMMCYDKDGNYIPVYYKLLGEVDLYLLIEQSLWRDGDA